MLGGVDRPTSGKIWIEDTDISTLSEKQLSVFRRRKVGLIYQFYNLIPSLDVKQNILLPLLLDGQKPEEESFRELSDTLGLSDRLSHLPSQLSGGQQQRAAIGRALIYRPAVLLADEPTGSVKLVQHYPKEIPVILFSLSMRISEITDRHSVRFSSRVSDS